MYDPLLKEEHVYPTKENGIYVRRSQTPTRSLLSSYLSLNSINLTLRLAPSRFFLIPNDRRRKSMQETHILARATRRDYQTTNRQR
ncbi:hypothetical protein PUN28_017665 [Cardiocondyla obscurior]|uniref:Uncharacterized protein n=1 Tax=Cardiocondyla obscurior TaxID=286306 RepID=A0AAW2ENX8_9HYME